MTDEFDITWIVISSKSCWDEVTKSQYVFILVSSYHLSSVLLNWFNLVYWLIGQSNIPARKESNVPKPETN
mgnify:CR=1 FL=1